MKDIETNKLTVENIYDENGEPFQNIIEKLLIRYYNQHFD